MADQLFLFTQMEFPWMLGPSDGRYVLRSARGEVEHVLVLGTLGAARSARRRVRAKAREAQAQPTPVPVTRVTVIDPVPLSSESQARRWLGELDGELESGRAVCAVNRLLFAQRIAVADPYAHELSPAQAILIRSGWGKGEEVADGRFSHALELPEKSSRRRGRVAALRPEERLAVLLGARDEALLCEELALRASRDLEQGRLRHAALELEQAYAAALSELPADERADLTERVTELRSLSVDVRRAAAAALEATTSDRADSPSEAELDERELAHALDRLKAALRARTAAGFPAKS